MAFDAKKPGLDALKSRCVLLIFEQQETMMVAMEINV